jgi:hypothetical protein
VVFVIAAEVSLWTAKNRKYCEKKYFLFLVKYRTSVPEKRDKKRLAKKFFKMKKDSRGGNSGQNKLGEVLTLPS